MFMKECTVYNTTYKMYANRKSVDRCVHFAEWIGRLYHNLPINVLGVHDLTILHFNNNVITVGMVTV